MLRRLAGAAALLAAAASGDEMAFVDVSSDDNLVVRTLDVRMQRKAGIAGFFESDPMASHDWALRNTTTVVFNSHLKAALTRSSVVARRLQQLEQTLAPLFAQLPKNEHGGLDRGAVRYAMHRYFLQTHGWSMKGLQPAGGAWILTMPVTPDVRQLVKFIVPTFLIELTFNSTGPKGVDVRWLAVLVAILEHMIRSEMMDYLFFTYSAFGIKTGRKLGQDDVDRIVSTFIMVFAFGTDLEVSTARALDKALAYLDRHHAGWQALRSYVRSMLKKSASEVSDFGSILWFLEDVADKYRDWQERDCSRARDELAQLPGAAPGRVPLASVKPSTSPGFRTLFAEQEVYLDKLGVLERSEGAPVQLIVPNYVASQAMCLSTASFYTVCCKSPCDDRLARLESAAAGPVATLGSVVQTLAEAAAALREGPRREELAALAGTDDRIRLHSREFAGWLHKLFPADCPAPSSHRHTNPRTADEWMDDPGGNVQETEELMMEIADVLLRFTTLGFSDEGYEEDDEDVLLPTSHVYANREGQQRETGELEAPGFMHAVSRAPFQVAVGLSLLGLAFLVVGGLAHVSDRSRTTRAKL